MTESGLQFLQENIGGLATSLLGSTAPGGVMTFEVPSSTGTAAIVDYTICPGGANPSGSPPTCTAEINLAGAALEIVPHGPNHLRVFGTLPLRLQNLPIAIDYGILGTDTATVVLNGNGTCPGEEQFFAPLPLEVDITLAVDSDDAHLRGGYSRLAIESITSNASELTSYLSLDCGSSISGDLLDLFRGEVVGMLYDSLITTVADAIRGQLCQSADPTATPTCPDGTFDVDGTCRYGNGASADCLPMLLGLEGRLNLGGLFSSLSPGTSGALDIALVAGGKAPRNDGSQGLNGDLNPSGNGFSLGMVGGAEPSPLSGCVKLSDLALPGGIPFPAELLAADTLSGWPSDVPGPHLGVAVSERYLNYALKSAYNSGALCLGITTESVPMLNSGLIQFVVPSLQDLGLQREAQQIAIVIRPQTAPSIAIGNGTDIKTDPLLRLTLNQASFDFYIWSLDRFVRFMTATMDIDVPMNLTMTPEGLQPVLEKLNIANAVVTNASLLRENPTELAKTLGGLISSQVGSALGGGLPAFDIGGALSSFGLGLNIPESVDGASPGLRKLTQGSDSFLGIFASLALVDASAARSMTSAELRTDPHELSAEFATDSVPEVVVQAASSLDNGRQTVEYAYRVDGGAWHPFTRARTFHIRDGAFVVEGVHQVGVRSRIAGHPYSLDPSPAVVLVAIDHTAPRVTIKPSAGNVSLDVEDNTSPTDQIFTRHRFDGGAFTDWQLGASNGITPPPEADEIEVEARDEQGRIGTARQALIRGGLPPADPGGCSCDVRGANTGPVSGLFGVTSSMVLAALRRRASRANRGRTPPSRTPKTRRDLRALHMLFFIALGIPTISSGCTCGDVSVETEPPSYACVAPCQALEPGVVGAYSSVAADANATWVAAYAEADRKVGHIWGDLVVGKWDGTKIDWTAVDGVPSEPAPDGALFDTLGYRGGQVEAGDDVGLWTSIALNNGIPSVAYYDRTNRALKFAQWNGTAWTSSFVERRNFSDLGRYAKLLFVNGAPVIVYLAMDPQGDDGMIRSSVRIATGNNASPREGEWTISDAIIEPHTPCRASFCQNGTKCVAASGRCVAPLAGAACATKCAAGEACFDVAGVPTCGAVYDASKLDTYPQAIGDYISVAQTSAAAFAIAYYDRIRGNLVLLRNEAGAWKPTVLDGETESGQDTGDMGIGATLLVDQQGTYRLAYVDGQAEELRYLEVRAGEVPKPEIVDDGFAAAGVVFPDGKHLVGDDVRMFISQAGEVLLAYQDATAGTLRFSVGAMQSGGHQWDRRVLAQDGFAGAFPQFVGVQGKLLVSNFWRKGGARTEGGIGFVQP